MVDNLPIALRLRSSSAVFREQFSNPDHITEEYRRKNPLENPLIIHHVFSFLTFDAIKQFRLVCRKWNYISIGYMEKMATAVLRSKARIAKIEESYFEKRNIFSDMPKVTFRAFKIQHSNCERFLPTVTRFLEAQKLHIRKLKFDNIGYHRIPNCYWINSMIGNNLNHLAIEFSDLAVPVDKLTSIKYLDLENCRIDVASNCSLAPESLRMKNVAVFRDNSVVRNLVVNEILNFEHLKHLSLHNSRGPVSCNYSYNTILSINVAGPVTLETLKLENIVMESLEESNWKITGNVELIGTPFYIRTCDDPVCRMLQPLVCFVNCQNLTTLTLVDSYSVYELDNQILHTKWIPQSVKTLTISGLFKLEGTPITLDTVVVQKFDPDYLLSNLQTLNSNHLILDINLARESWIYKMDEIIFTVIQTHYNSLAIGNYQIVDGSKCYKYVDKAAFYYAFKKKEGTAIQGEEFKEIVQTAMKGIRSE